ncbi:MAG TPA: TonB family protein [Thermoanaerobaculia bacterium]|nr:TonB family protein [Thermoanaerobaculia bacterium]
MTSHATRHKRGLLVVVLLGAIFFVLLALLVLSAGKERREIPLQTETLTVLAPRIRLRTEPSAKAPVVTTAIAGEQLLLLEDRGSWVRLQNGEGLSGWADRSALERTGERSRRLARYAAIRKLPPLQGRAIERTTLFAGPGIFYPVVGELPHDTEVRVFTRDHDFYAIDHMGQVAYADVDAIEVIATGSPQFDVASNEPPPSAPPATATGETEPPPPAQTALPEPPEPVTPPPAPAPAEGGGVYAAVPPGGTQPEEIERVIPRYPQAARLARVSGTVVIRGIVRKDGRIDNVEVIKDLPYGLGEAAREAVSRWRFRPATYRGEPIDVYYTVNVNFRLR